MESRLRQTPLAFPKAKDHHSTSTPKLFAGPSERKNLQTIQLNKVKQPVFASKENKHLTECSTYGTPVRIYTDPIVPPECPVTTCCRDTQTDNSLLTSLLQERWDLKDTAALTDGTDVTADSGQGSTLADQETLDLLTSDAPSETYWKDLADERRRALKETLQENERLCSEIEVLKEENNRLGEVEKRAETLEEMLNDIMADDSGNPEEVEPVTELSAIARWGSEENLCTSQNEESHTSQVASASEVSNSLAAHGEALNSEKDQGSQTS